MFKYFIAFLTSILLVGCLPGSPVKLYSGPYLASSQLSTISCGDFVRIAAIDGKSLSNVKDFCSFEVYPGSHTVTYKDYKNLSANVVVVYDKKHKVQFVTKKAHTYKLAITRPEGIRTFWLYELDENNNITTEKFKYKEIEL